MTLDTKRFVVMPSADGVTIYHQKPHVDMPDGTLLLGETKAVAHIADGIDQPVVMAEVIARALNDIWISVPHGRGEFQ